MNHSNLWRRAGVLGVLAVACALPAAAASLSFAGYTWDVRSGGGGPGPNTWDPRNAWVDDAGALHLLVTQRDGRWTAAEVTLTERLGFGTYQFQLQGRPDLLDRNLVLGLFNYPDSDQGGDGTNEIDIEYAQWGQAAADHGNWTIYPAVAGPKPLEKTFPIHLNGDRTTHRFTWSPTGVRFVALHGTQDIGSEQNPIDITSFTPRKPQRRIPQQALPVHLNLWLFKGRQPTDGQPVEMVISSFRFVPQQPALEH